MAAKFPIITIVGPTASGKSKLAIELCEKFRGEIICADSRTIYNGMDIGTAKPTEADRQRVRHHCLDLAKPTEKFSAADFKSCAEASLTDILGRGKVPFIVGGSGLYIDAVIYNYDFPPRKKDDEVRNMSLEELQQLAVKKGIKVPEQTFLNKRHLTGLILRNGLVGKRELKPGVLQIGITKDREQLLGAIDKRVEDMVQTGFIEEVKSLLEKYGDSVPAFAAPGYQPFIDYLQGQINFEEAKALFKRNDKQLAKRQITWFKRNKDIHWVRTYDNAEQLIAEILDNF